MKIPHASHQDDPRTTRAGILFLRGLHDRGLCSNCLGDGEMFPYHPTFYFNCAGSLRIDDRRYISFIICDSCYGTGLRNDDRDPGDEAPTTITVYLPHGRSAVLQAGP